MFVTFPLKAVWVFSFKSGVFTVGLMIAGLYIKKIFIATRLEIQLILLILLTVSRPNTTLLVIAKQK